MNVGKRGHGSVENPRPAPDLLPIKGMGIFSVCFDDGVNLLFTPRSSRVKVDTTDPRVTFGIGQSVKELGKPIKMVSLRASISVRPERLGIVRRGCEFDGALPGRVPLDNFLEYV